MIKTIFLDVDGVIADFTGHALTKFGKPGLLETQTPGEYSIAKLLGISESKFWKQIDCPAFWSTIPAYPGSHYFVRQLFMYCKQKEIKLHYCTVGTSSKYYSSARTNWLREFDVEAGVSIPSILMSSWRDKVLLARKGRLFIDDNDKIVNGVREAGAHAVQIPQLWNQLHSLAMRAPDYASAYLRMQLGVTDESKGRGSMGGNSNDGYSRGPWGPILQSVISGHSDIAERICVYCKC